jgi:DNA-binding response OmpR family regulator
MIRRQQILVVSQSPKVGNSLLLWLGEAGYELSIVTTFQAAKVHLESAPHLVITELKLGDYNGLHVALRAKAVGIPAIVLGPEDSVLEKDAKEFGATYIKSALRRKSFLELVETLLGEAHDRRWVPTLPTVPIAADVAWLTAAPHHTPGRRVLMN